MINRRRILVALGFATFSALDSPLCATIQAADLSTAADTSLSSDFARIASRVYSEEGVPMFLACENLSAAEIAPNEPAIPSALNRKVASAVHRYASEWQQLHPDAPAGDVAKILELIADRDFASGGTEPSL